VIFVERHRHPGLCGLMLASHRLLFLFFQAVIALVLFLNGQPNAWDGSARWRLFTVIPIMPALMNTLAAFIFGDSMALIQSLFRPLPGWALALGSLLHDLFRSR
jgi:hypothetical protein